MENSCHSHCCSCGHKSSKNKIVPLIAGASVFAAGIVLNLLKVHTYAAFVVFLTGYAILGGDVVERAVKNILKGRVFDENFLMCAATIGAFALGDYPEAVAVMLFYQVGEFFQEKAVLKTRKSIAGLMDIRPDYANLKDGEIVTRVSPEAVKPGNVIIVKTGEKIPLDGVVLEGESTLDTSSLTGESLPRSVKKGDSVLAGCVNQSGLLTVKVSKTFGDSTAAKIIDLVENAGAKKAPAERFITKFSRYYTPVVVLLALAIAVIPPLLGSGVWYDWIHRGLVFLVISCPCALVLSVPLSFFCGIGRASRQGILIKGANYLEALNELDIIIFDKTGTLTKGVFEVTEINASDGFTTEEVLEFAASAEAFSNHPISASVLRAYGKTPSKVEQYHELAGRGVCATVNGRVIYAGNRKLMGENGIQIPSDNATTVHVTVDGSYAGSIILSDTIRADSKRAILGLKTKGVRRAIMLTGDNANAAEAVARALPLDEVHAQLLPHEKAERLEAIDLSKRRGGKLAFIGDGINDAPVLARADIGIAMGGLGSDAAIEAADIVLMTDEPSKLVTAVQIANKTRRVVWQNIIFSLAVKAAVLLLGALGTAGMWEAVFADVGVSLLAVLNAVRILRR